MEPRNDRSWPPTGPPNSSEPSRDPHSPLQQRPHQGYGHNPPGPPSQLPGPPSLPPPSQGGFYGQQSSGASLPSLSGLTQSSPPQAQHAPPPHQRSSPISHHQQAGRGPPQQPPSYSLPGINQAMQQGQPERERQIYEAEMRNAEERNRQEQQRMGEQQRSPETHGGTVPLRQPVASRATGILHGPNGILSQNPDVGGVPPPSAAPGPQPSYQSAHGHETGRPYMQQAPPAQPPAPQTQQASHPAQAAPQGGAQQGIPQGQQPILNDALTYLDQVKVRFQSQPDVYNKFLDIMKDFKSQTIDTPGVINRVSALFSGHPHLIQGFNTFLPPGYKIEAGWGNDPNNIRVYTPLGSHEANTASLSIQGGATGEAVPEDRSGQQEAYHAGWQRQGDGRYSPSRVPPEQRVAYDAHYAHQDQVHQQEQHGVSQLQAASAAASQQGRLAAMQQGGATIGSALNGAQVGATAGQQLNMEKRAPVEFNHAISYVNKIKTRFQHQPEIYKQFLDILQTYQKESKPIQDVYAQVTQLFGAAPDLLEDFKQFLPESAAQAKAQAAARQATEDAAMLSNVRGDPNYIAGISNTQAQTPKPDKMPPIGNFAPPSASKDNSKKRRGGPGATLATGSAVQDLTAGRSGLQSATAGKRQKTAGTKAIAADIVPVPSPTLVPELPHPMPPTTSSSGSMEEIAFFDRVKKYVANKQTYNEFLKLCNLFGQDLIDKNTLVEKAEGFLGQNADLIGFFKKFVRYTGRDEVIDNRPVPSDNRVALSLCRALGPSYRLLPKRERFAKCSGRDEMCHNVLNDEWASHPTWASEDSGFIAHRKNTFEEALHRMEEERHDYDFNIETTLRTIQLLEPIVQQISLMGPEEKKAYRLPQGLGGQSEAIWQRVIKKIYDRPVGCKIIQDMQDKPARVAPFLLIRLKEKAEVWKQAQREWEKIWREQTHKQFWRSLDHQGLSAKADNKRSFQPKALQTDIQAKYEEQKRQRQTKALAKVSRYQLTYDFSDVDVIQDCCHILLTYLHHSHGGNDQNKIESFIKTFIPTFFGIDKDAFVAKMADIYTDSPPNEEEEDSNASEEPTTQRSSRQKGKKEGLIRSVLDPSRQTKRDDSKESTPDPMSVDDDAGTASDSQSEQPARVDPSEGRWMEHPMTGNARSVRHNEPFYRETFSLYANLNIYCFVRIFQMLYQRLCYIKSNEDAVREDVKRAMMSKPAVDLRIADKSPADFFEDTSSSANYYQQILKMCEGVMQRSVDMTKIEETLRRFYLAHGWQLYSFDKMVVAIIKFAAQVIVNDAKDRSNDIVNLFLANRKEAETTHQAEIDYRKQVEKLAKDGEIYRIVYNQASKTVSISIFKKEDMTFDVENMGDEFSWSYYVTSFVMRDRTEGVPASRLAWPYLRRNNPYDTDGESDVEKTELPKFHSEGLQVRISPNNYRLLWEVGTTDWFVHDKKMQARGLGGIEKLQQERKDKFEDKFVKHTKWSEGLPRTEIDKVNADYQRLISGEEPSAPAEAAPPAAEAESKEETMADAK